MDMVKWYGLQLERRDAAINISNDCGRTPLLYATGGHRTTDYLLLRQSDIMAGCKDNLGNIPLSFAATIE
jgi:hypothetical protein